MTLPGTDTARRLKVASSLVLLVGAIAVAAVANGCMPAQTTPDAQPTQSPAPEPTIAPTASPQPTITPTTAPGPIIIPDGVYGPGLFIRGTDCTQGPFFGSQYTGTLTVTGNGTADTIAESQSRSSTGTYNPAIATSTLTGAGLVGTQQATWTVNIVFTSAAAVVRESIRLTSNGCQVEFVSQVLNKR